MNECRRFVAVFIYDFCSFSRFHRGIKNTALLFTVHKLELFYCHQKTYGPFKTQNIIAVVYINRGACGRGKSNILHYLH